MRRSPVLLAAARDPRCLLRQRTRLLVIEITRFLRVQQAGRWCNSTGARCCPEAVACCAPRRAFRTATTNINDSQRLYDVLEHAGVRRRCWLRGSR